jgi:hypothetical protein
VVVVAALTAVGGCTTGADPAGPGTAPSPTRATASAPTSATADQGEVRAAVGAVLRSRAAAVLDGDERAFTATVAEPAAPAGRRQLDTFSAARALRVSRLEVGDVVVDVLGTDPATARAEVDLRYRVDDLDRGDRVARLEYTLVDTGAGWQVRSEGPVGPGATAPWVAMPGLRVHRGKHAVVAGTVPDRRLAEHAAVADRALPALREDWPRTPRRVLVLAPSTAAEADALLGRSGAGEAPVAATTEGPTDADGRATGDRVVLDPTAFDRLTPAGRDVVLTHELVHVAVRAGVAGRAAAWLTEGYADHIGYRRADVSTRRLVAPLVAAIRTGHGPRRLPTLAEMQPASGDIEVPYLAAWQAVEVVAAQHGEGALRRLVAAGASTGSDADAEAATDRALRTVLGTSRAELTDAWLTRLGQLASAG